jgi:hypothetical protein
MPQRIQALEHLGRELARVAAEAERTSQKPASRMMGGLTFRLRGRVAAIAVAATVIVAGGVVAVPGTRAAFDSVLDTFAGWAEGDDSSAPGRAVEPGDNAPRWLRHDTDTRLIAKTQGIGLYVKRTDSEQGPVLEVALGQAISMADTLDGWRQRLGHDAVVLLGYTPFGPQDPLDERGRLPAFGVTTRDVKRVELRYSEGPSLTGDVGDGGFVLLADAWRPPHELIAYDAAGRVLDRVDVSEYDMRYVCEKEPVCPPGTSSTPR